MKKFKLKKYEKFNIIGRGTIFTAHKDENNIKGIKVGSLIVTEDDGYEYEVTGIESFYNMIGKGKNLGLLVKRKYTIEEICEIKGIEFHPLKEGEKSEWAQIIDRRQELINEIGLYRLGRKQKRALLDKDGNEIALFSKKHKDVAQEMCTLLNLNVYKKIKRIIDEEFKDVEG